MIYHGTDSHEGVKELAVPILTQSIRTLSGDALQNKDWCAGIALGWRKKCPHQGELGVRRSAQRIRLLNSFPVPGSWFWAEQTETKSRTAIAQVFLVTLRPLVITSMVLAR